MHGLYNFDNFIIKLLEALDARADDIDAYEHPVYKMEYCLTPENTAYKKNACLFNLVSALTKAGETLSEKYGSNPYDWKYGNIHTYRLPHVPFSRFPAL